MKHLTPFQIGVIIFCVLMIGSSIVFSIRNFRKSDRVLKFKTHILFNYPMSVTIAMPTYNQLMKDKRELKIENFVPNYKTMNDDNLTREDVDKYIAKESL